MIAIKEMDMPENCLKCPFIDESGQYCQVDGKVLYGSIQDGILEIVKKWNARNSGK